MNIPMVAPVFPAGKEPLPPGITEEERENYMQARKYQNGMTMGMESCVAKTAIAGGGGASLLSATCCSGCAMGVHRPRRAWLGFVIGAFFSLMSSSFAYEDPLLRQTLSTQQKARAIFKEMGQGMYKSGKGFGKVGALFAGIECVIESVSSAYSFVNA